MNPGTGRIAAHRGGALEAPENTIGAFDHAVALGADEVEFDVQLSADGVPVVFHDATLDRMTDGTGPLAARPWAELRGLRVAGAARDGIPTLQAVLERLAPTPIAPRMELKPAPDGRPFDGMAARAIAALDRHGLLARTTVTSFFVDYLREGPATALPRILLVNPLVFRCLGGLPGLLPAAERAGTRHLALPIGDIDAALVRAASAEGLTLSAFAAHRADQIDAALDLGLPVFTTDRPTLALERRALRTGTPPSPRTA